MADTSLRNHDSIEPAWETKASECNAELRVAFPCFRVAPSIARSVRNASKTGLGPVADWVESSHQFMLGDAAAKDTISENTAMNRLALQSASSAAVSRE